MRKVDNLVIGGGLFGVYAALIAPKNESTILMEKEDSLMLRASSVNQARLHSGLHYLRSVRTAETSQFYFSRFLQDHRIFVNGSFDHLYLIDKQNSLSSPNGLLRVANKIGIEVDRKGDHPAINAKRVAAIFKVTEPSIDLEMLGDYYRKKTLELEESPLLNAKILEVTQFKGCTVVTLSSNLEVKEFLINKKIIVAAYSGLNSVLSDLGITPEVINYELSEVIYGKSDLLSNLGITVMDGQHVSTMPYGFSGLSTITSVKYSHRAATQKNLLMTCQVVHGRCRPNSFFNCGTCRQTPSSAGPYIVNQLQKYLSSELNFTIHANKFEVKAFWNASPSFDHRFTSIKRYSMNNSNTQVYGVLSGKLSSIYELESIYDEQ